MANISTKEKIDAIIKWVKTYPNLTLYKMRNKNYIINKYGNELSKQSISRLEKKYNKLREFYIYLSFRKNSGKLSEDELLRLKNSNVGGVFGYSSEVEELANKNNISNKMALQILSKYSTIENFYTKFKENSIKDIEYQVLAERIFIPVYNIDQDSRYDKLVMELIDNDKTLNIYSSKKIEEVLQNNFDERQIKIIKNRFGLVDPRKTLEELAKEVDICVTRVRTIEANIIKKLKSQLLKDQIICEEDKVMDLLSEEDKKLLQDSIRTAYVSKDNKEEVKIANICIKSIIMNNDEFITSINGSKRDKEKDMGISLESLGFDSYFIKYLKRRELFTLGDLFKPENMMMLRKMEKESLSKIKEKVSELGYTLKVEKDDFTLTGDIEKDIDFPLACLDINIKTYNALSKRKIYTLEDLLKFEGDVLKIHNMGEKGYRELLEQIHIYGYHLKKEKPKKETESAIEVLRTENEELKQKNKEAEEKERLIDEYILLTQEQELLKTKLAQKEQEIKRKQELLKSKGLI